MLINSNNKKKNLTDSYKKDKNYKDIFEKFDFISSEIADVFMQVSLTGKILYISPSCERITGFKPEEVKGKRFTLFAPKKEWPKYFKKLKSILEGKIITNFETVVLKKDGSNIQVEFSGYPSTNGGYFNAIMRNISNRKNVDNRYRLLFENSECPITYLDKSGNILLINEYGAHNLNERKDKLIGKSIYNLLPEFAEEQKKRFDEIIKSGKGLLKDDIIKLPDNNYKWFYSNLQPIKDRGNNITGIQIVSIDITDLKNTELKLKESEEKFHSIFDTSIGAILLTDKNGKITDVNPSGLKILGYDKKEELIDRYAFENYEYPEKHEILMNELMKKGYVNNHEITFKRKDGSLVHCIGSLNFLRDRKGVIIGTIGNFLDITDKAMIQKEIKNTKDYLQNIIDNTSEIIITVDSEFKIKIWNKTAERIIGYKKRDIKNKKIHAINLFEYSSEIRNFVKNILNKKPVILKEINIKTAFGNYITLSVSSSFIKNEFDEIKEIIFICKDITLQKEHKEKILFGHSYIIDNVNINNSLKIFHDLIINKKGIYIGRNIDENLLSHKKNKEIIIIELSTNIDNESPIINNLNNLVGIIEKNVNKNEGIILFDRIDFLITKFTFEEVIRFLYKINDIIEKYKSIMLIRINSNFLNENQLSILYEEFEKLPSQKISNVIIDDDLLEIIKYVNNENSLNINVTYGDIGRIFNISKVTVKKRIEILTKKELIYSRKIGKTKLLYLTDKGKNLISTKE